MRGGPMMVEQTMTPVKKTNGTLHRWDPFDVFETLQQEVERFWPRPSSFGYGPLLAIFPRLTGMTLAPRTDVFEKDNTLVFKVEMPGMRKEDVQVEIEDGNVV